MSEAPSVCLLWATSTTVWFRLTVNGANPSLICAEGLVLWVQPAAIVMNSIAATVALTWRSIFISRLYPGEGTSGRPKQKIPDIGDFWDSAPSRKRPTDRLDYPPQTLQQAIVAGRPGRAPPVRRCDPLQPPLNSCANRAVHVPHECARCRRRWQQRRCS